VTKSDFLGEKALSRRELAGMLLAGGTALRVSSSQAGGLSFIDGWIPFVRRLVSPEGRVIDIENGGISHSEGSGYGLILATEADDRATFQRIWSWTQANLMIRGDGLAAWKWTPGKGVEDSNNASDGDLLIALGLARAWKRWGDQAMTAAARRIAQVIREKLIVQLAGLTLLLPGEKGFERDGKLILNPSYMVMPAIRAMAELDPSDTWDALARGALVLLAKARMSRYQLPPDWLELAVDGSVDLPSGFKAQFGYDAIRVPLYLAWGGYNDPYYFRPYAALANAFPKDSIPATVGLPSGITGQNRASAGMLAVYRLASRQANVDIETSVLSLNGSENYYSTVLYLLTVLVDRELGVTP